MSDSEINTLKEFNKKLLLENNMTIDKLKSHMDHVSNWSQKQSSEGYRTVLQLEQQINSLVKSINRTEGILVKRDEVICNLESKVRDQLHTIDDVKSQYENVKHELSSSIDQMQNQCMGIQQKYESKISDLEAKLTENQDVIESLQGENKQYLEVRTQLEMCQGDMTKVQQELLDTKVEHNKLKMIYDSDLLNNYERSLKDANDKLNEADLELEKCEAHYKQVLEQVLNYQLNTL